MKKYELNGSQKIIVISLILFIIVVSMISKTSNMLKNDAEQTHKNLVKIYNDTFVEHLNNSLYNIELFTNNLKIIYLKKSNDQVIQQYLHKYLKENVYVRSINILEENIINKSTNKQNIGVEVNSQEYYPIAMFDEEILRFGNSYSGRDFYEYKKVDSSNEYSYSKGFFIPIIRTMSIKNKKISVLIALNAEEFLNKYSLELEKESGHLEILNLNAEVLISNDMRLKIGEKVLNTNLENALKEKGSYLAIENFKSDNKYIISVENIKNYPLSLLLRFDYENSLKNWEEKRLNFLFIITILLIFIIILILIFVIKADNNRLKEIGYHKLQVKNQKRFKLLFEQSDLFF